MTDLALYRMNRFWLTRALDGAVHLSHVWRERARGRAELARLSAYELADIGLSRTERWAEVNKPFWRH